MPKPAREPARIARLLALVQQVWEANPDWRFGQLVSNVMDREDRDDARRFYQEDDVTECQLREAVARGIGQP